MRTRAIVLSAFAVHPDMPSEPGVGWQFLIATLEHARTAGVRVVLVTMRRSEQACRGRIPSDYVEFLDIVAVDIPHSPRFFRWHYPRFTRVEHELWVRLAVRHVRAIEERVDVVYAQHVTFATEILSTPITRMSAHTFKVWGPIGAGGVADVYGIAPTPLAAVRQRVLQKLRDRLARIPASRVARRCNLVLAQNGALDRVLASSPTEIRRFPNVVVDLPDIDRTRRPHKGTHVLVVGHLIARKRQELAVHAMAASKMSGALLNVVGFPLAPHTEYLRELVRRLGVEERVIFHGALPRETVLKMMIQADVLFHPSGREGASGVVGEAATCGLPVVCFAGTGASSVLEQSATSGVILPADTSTTRETLADALVRAAALPRLVTSQWTQRRFVDLATQLYADGSEFRASSTSGAP